MSVARSPRYPAIGLREAIDKVKLVYQNDYQNRIPKELVAKHIGYNGLNGKSLGVISAINKYGLLDGGAEQMWVTDRAVAILVAPKDDFERSDALKAAGSEPELFADLNANFQGKSSDAALRSFLITKRKFLPDAADKAVKAYRETQELLSEESASIREMLGVDEPIQPLPVEIKASGQSHVPEISATHNSSLVEAKSGTRREIITLDEGDVVIIFPENLSHASFSDLKDYLDLFIKKMQRRTGPRVD